MWDEVEVAEKENREISIHEINIKFRIISDILLNELSPSLLLKELPVTFL